MLIPDEQIEFHPLSQMDMNGRLFRWNDGLYRAIRLSATGLYQDLFDRQLVDQLIDRKLMVETQRTDLNIGGYGMVVKHRRLPFVSYPYEWSAGMFKAAALKVLDLQIELQRHGLSLHDAHPWNVLFEGTEPFYIDFTSITLTSAKDEWPMYSTFCDMFLHPLLMMREGCGYVARRLLFDMERGVSSADVAAMIGKGRGIRAWQRGMDAAAGRLMSERIHRGIARRLGEAKQRAKEFMARLRGLESLRERIRAMKIREPFDKRADFLDHPVATEPVSNLCERAIDELVRKHRPTTILDAGPDPRRRAAWETRGGAQIVSWSTQPCWSEELYQQSCRAGGEGARRVLSLVMSLRAPTPGYGIGHHMAVPAAQRFGCQAVVVMDMLHRMMLRYQLSFKALAETLSALGEKYALVEYIPPANPSESPAWYTLEHLCNALRVHYPEVTVLGGSDEPRPVVLCARKTMGEGVSGYARI